MSQIIVNTTAFDDVSVTLYFDHQPEERDTDTRESAELTQVDWHGIDVLELMGEDEISHLEENLMIGEYNEDCGEY